MTDTSTAESEVAESVVHTTTPRARLMLLVATNDGCNAYELGATRPLLFGRAHSADIAVDDASVSRQHARFECDGTRVTVSDLGSRNGTWFNGERVEQAALSPGATVVIGVNTVTVQLAPPARSSQLGLLSQDSVIAQLDEECARAYAYQRPFSLVVLRSLGAGEIGRETLAQVRAELRPTDRVGLYDRDALLLLLPELTPAAAARVVESMLTRVPDLAASISSVPHAGFTPGQLLASGWEAARRATRGQRIVHGQGLTAVREATAPDLVRRSRRMQRLREQLERLAVRSLPVLIFGETGAGKEHIARELHRLSARAAAPFRVVNCAAIPETLIERVLLGPAADVDSDDDDQLGVLLRNDGGTVLLDELGELSRESQTVLLRVLDVLAAAKTDLRLLAASHRDLATLCNRGAFRLDLYHRLAGAVLEVPPLRDCRDDIEPLVVHFLERHAQQTGTAQLSVTPEAMALLYAHAWPGNVRELANVVERAAALAKSEVVTVAELPTHLRVDAASVDEPAASVEQEQESTVSFPDAGIDLRARVHDHEAQLISEALRRTRGNQRRAAVLLQLPLRTLERKLRALGPRAQS